MNESALSNVRVLDLSRILAGPWCAQILADLGADVIKIERPGRGDDTRAWGPPYVRNANGEDTTEAAYYVCANRGKRSVTVDIAVPAGQAVIRALAAQSDVLIENYKVGGLAQYGLDYASLADLNPRLVYCSITGFGQTGPYAHRPGYDFVAQAMGGVMSVTGERDDLPGGGPQKVGVAVADISTGLYATIAIQAALAYRERSGVGQYIDMALLDCQVAFMANQATAYLASQEAPKRAGNAHQTVVPYQVFATSDSHIVVAVGNDTQFRRLCELLGTAELADDGRFAANEKRVRNREALIPLLAARLSEQSSGHWLRALESAGVPCCPINSLDQVFADPQVKHRKMEVALEHPLAGEVHLPASPLKLSRTPPEYRCAPPTLGQHTDEVLREILHYDDAQLRSLREAGTID
ncbi:MAG: CoA transferase [Gammaproteobacteria bacterium]|nr:CoA transferase [Gammaproteobacteria bacterium]